MNTAEILAAVDALYAVDQAFAAKVLSGRDADVAARLSQDVPKQLKKGARVTSRGIYENLGMADGAAVMHVLKSLAAGKLPNGTDIPTEHPLKAYVPVFSDMVPWLQPPCEGLDFGTADLQTMVTTLEAAGLFTAMQAEKLRNLGLVPGVVTPDQVTAALNTRR